MLPCCHGGKVTNSNNMQDSLGRRETGSNPHKVGREGAMEGKGCQVDKLQQSWWSLMVQTRTNNEPELSHKA